MNESLNPTASGHPLAPILVDTLHLVRRIRLEKQDLSTALHAALDVIHERDTTVDRLRRHNLHLLAQLRALASGKTIAEERQQLDDEVDTPDVVVRPARSHPTGRAA